MRGAGGLWRWGFASAEFIQPGDVLIDEHKNEQEVDSVVRIDAPRSRSSSGGTSAIKRGQG